MRRTKENIYNSKRQYLKKEPKRKLFYELFSYHSNQRDLNYRFFLIKNYILNNDIDSTSCTTIHYLHFKKPRNNLTRVCQVLLKQSDKNGQSEIWRQGTLQHANKKGCQNINSLDFFLQRKSN